MKRTAQIDETQYPQYVYNYRPGKPHDFNSVKEQYLWTALPEMSKDEKDSFVNVDWPKELQLIERWMLVHIGEIIYYQIKPIGMQKKKGKYKLTQFKQEQVKYLNADGSYNDEKAKTAILLHQKRLSLEQQHKFNKLMEYMYSDEFKQEIKDCVQSNINQIKHYLRKNTFIGCVTTEKNNPTMWENYARDKRGFVIEYDLSKIEFDDSMYPISELFPIEYVNELPYISILPLIKRAFYDKLYNKEYVNSQNTELFIDILKQLFVKRQKYNFECEWRFISKTHKLSLPVSAVYMGRHICKTSENKLIQICKKNKISLYKQYLDSNNDMQFKCILKNGEYYDKNEK
jgi:hypothetical protein